MEEPSKFENQENHGDFARLIPTDTQKSEEMPMNLLTQAREEPMIHIEKESPNMFQIKERKQSPMFSQQK